MIKCHFFHQMLISTTNQWKNMFSLEELLIIFLIDAISNVCVYHWFVISLCYSVTFA